MRQVISKISLAAVVVSTAACGIPTEKSQSTTQASDSSRLIFRCTLDQSDSKSLSIFENDGWVSTGDFLSSPMAVIKTQNVANGSRSYRFVKGWLDYNNETSLVDLTIRIAKGNGKDSVTIGDRKVNCRYKATINSAVLDALAVATETEPNLRALAAGESYGLCQKFSHVGNTYGQLMFKEQLADGRWLFPMYCDLGAYQGTYQLVLWDDVTRQGKIIQTEEYDFETGKIGKTDYLFGVADFDKQTGIFTTFAKCRGIGDCGSMTKFLPLKDDKLAINEIRAKLDCDGIFVPVEEWPLVYSALNTGTPDIPQIPTLGGTYRSANGAELHIENGGAEVIFPTRGNTLKGDLERDGSLGAAYNILLPEGYVCGSFHISLFVAEGEVGDGNTVSLSWINKPEGSVLRQCAFMAEAEGSYTR